MRRLLKIGLQFAYVSWGDIAHCRRAAVGHGLLEFSLEDLQYAFDAGLAVPTNPITLDSLTIAFGTADPDRWHLVTLAEGAEADPADPDDSPEDTPRSLREGLSLLQIRVRNLQHALGLEAIPARNQPFDDRWHEACGVTHRPDLPDGQVVEEILPGYRLGERVVRPARVIVNLHT